MALITCPECKKEVSDQAEVCIHCGYPLKKQVEGVYKRYAVILTDAGENIDFVVGLVQEYTGANASTAKEICKLAPKSIKSDISEEKAYEIKRKFEELGATVEIFMKRQI